MIKGLVMIVLGAVSVVLSLNNFELAAGTLEGLFIFLAFFIIGIFTVLYGVEQVFISLVEC